MNQDANPNGIVMPKEKQPLYLPFANMLRVSAATAPVLYHVAYPYFNKYDSLNRTDWWLCNFIVAGTTWIVGAFLMLSGALLLDTAKKEPLKVFYRKRILRVGIPLCFWSVFYMAHEAIFSTNGLTIHEAMKRVVLGATAPHLYFLFAIGGLYVFAPVMRIYIAHATRKELFFGIILVFVMVVGGNLSASFAYEGWVGANAFTKFIPYLGYFLLGYYLRSVILSRKGLTWACVLCVGSVILTALGTYALIFKLDIGRTDLLHRAVSPTMIITTITAFLIFSNTFTGQDGGKTGKKNLVHKLAPATLGVFLIHFVFVWHGHDLGIMERLGSVWVSVPIVTFVILVISYLITFIIWRIPYVRRIVGL